MAFNDGGPAYPQTESVLVGDENGSHIVTNMYGGMSLWDEYAKAAMNALILAWTNEDHQASSENVADAAADYADAMIAEREKRRVQA